MKRYLVFFGGDFYPLGGMYDFTESFETESEALSFLEKNKYNYSWCHIFDLELAKIIYEIQ